MTRLNTYSVYIDDGENVYKIATPGESEEQAAQYWKGNGEVIAVKELNKIICTTEIWDALENAGYDHEYCDLVTRALNMVGIARD